MPKKLDKKIEDVLKKYGFGPEACWDCHGVWVIYHRVLEQIASKAGISFSQPFIVEARGDQRVAALCVTGAVGDAEEWSIGEASPVNNKNPYPWAMAEKRAKDRVILKLLGLHGDVYSEEEAEDFKEKKQHGSLHGPLKITELKAKMRAFSDDLSNCEDSDQFAGLMEKSKEVLAQCERDLPEWYSGNEYHDGAAHRIAEKSEQFTSKKENPDGLRT